MEKRCFWWSPFVAFTGWSAPSPKPPANAIDATASRYDLATRLLARPRRMEVEALALQFGETVLDVACGTGVNLPMLSRAVGFTRGCSESTSASGSCGGSGPRSGKQNLDNVELLLFGDILQIELPDADAALFSFTPRVCRRPAAVGAVVSSLRSDGPSRGDGIPACAPRSRADQSGRTCCRSALHHNEGWPSASLEPPRYCRRATRRHTVALRLALRRLWTKDGQVAASDDERLAWTAQRLR